MELLKSLLFFRDSSKGDKLSLKKDKTNQQWMVMKGHNIMYIGSKEKCQSYMAQA